MTYQRDNLICDFCNAKDPEWAYPVDDFSQDIVPPEEVTPETGQFEWTSRGGWSACQICHELIQREDREALAQRCIDSFTDTVPRDTRIRRQVLRRIRALHDEFFVMRSGDPVRDEEYVDPPGYKAGTITVDSGED